MAMQIALPLGWSTEKSNSTGHVYYFNWKTGESTWVHPAQKSGKVEWSREQDHNGQIYFFNHRTHDSTWEPDWKPEKSTRDVATQFADLTMEEIRTLVPTPRFLLNRRRSRSPFRRSPAPSPSPARRFRSPSNHGMNAVPPQARLLWQDSPHWVIAPQNYPKGKNPNGH